MNKNNKYFTKLVIVLYILNVTNCGNVLNNEFSNDFLNGEFKLIGYRSNNELIEISNDSYYSSIIYNFYGKNNIEVFLVKYNNEKSSYNMVFEIKNGKIRDRTDFTEFSDFLEPDEILGEWNEWQKYNFNNNVLEIELVPNSDIYKIYKKI